MKAANPFQFQWFYLRHYVCTQCCCNLQSPNCRTFAVRTQCYTACDNAHGCNIFSHVWTDSGCKMRLQMKLKNGKVINWKNLVAGHGLASTYHQPFLPLLNSLLRNVLLTHTHSDNEEIMYGTPSLEEAVMEMDAIDIQHEKIYSERILRQSMSQPPNWLQIHSRFHPHHFTYCSFAHFSATLILECSQSRSI